MRKSLMAAIAATCLILFGCGGGSSTEPHSRSTLAGSWVGTQGDLTIQMDIGADTNCSRTYGYCNVSGTGTYAHAGGSSGSFDLGGDYFINGQQIVLNFAFDPYVPCQFGGKFDSETQISGMLYETTSEASPLGVGIEGITITLVRQ